MLRGAFRVLQWAVATVVMAGVALSAYVSTAWNRSWDVPVPDLHASDDPETVALGEYLVFGPAHCPECHAEPSAFRRFADGGGPRPDLIGGQPFPAPHLGTIYARNITPDPDTGIGRFTDGQIARMLRYAVRPDGKASVRALMQYGEMSDDDIVAILSFLRSQRPVRHEVPKDEWLLVGKVVKSLAPSFKPREHLHPPRHSPPSHPTRERGAYLVQNVGECGGCHSPLNQLTFAVNGPELSGGVAMEPAPFPHIDRSMWFEPPNLTPLEGSALMRFPDRETFVARFQHGGRKFEGSPMPWDSFSRLTAEDAGALYEYLRSLAPAGQPAPEDPRVRREEP